VGGAVVVKPRPSSSPLSPLVVEKYQGYTVRWFCLPPDLGVTFTVTRERWSEDLRTRDIFGWKVPECVFDCAGYRLRVVGSWS
jgi:hypothetical protein